MKLATVVLLPLFILSAFVSKVEPGCPEPGECQQMWTVPVPLVATVMFVSPEIFGSFRIYDNRLDSGTRVEGKFERALDTTAEYRFEVQIDSRCNRLTRNDFFTFEVTYSFQPKGRDNADGLCMFRTTSVSWIFDTWNTNSVVVAYKEIMSKNSKGKPTKIWKRIACAPIKSANRKQLRA